jgi:glucosamine--fructose-6-phosphate aminotransferase (isomerizing)
MCGIVAYIGQQQASPIIIKGLKRLEYRGYDSTGISLYDGTELHTIKTTGKVSDLKPNFKDMILSKRQ